MVEEPVGETMKARSSSNWNFPRIQQSRTLIVPQVINTK